MGITLRIILAGPESGGSIPSTMYRSVRMDQYDTVANLKEKIQEVAGIPPEAQRLVASSGEMLDHQTLAYYGIKDGQPIRCYTVPASGLGSGGHSLDATGSSDDKVVDKGNFLYLPPLISSGPKASHERASKESEGYRRSVNPSMSTLGGSKEQVTPQRIFSSSKSAMSSNSPPQSNPTRVINPKVELPFLSEKETDKRIKAWQKWASLGKYDMDTHIVDPTAHYCHLEYLERYVVTQSEYLRCAGKYDLDDNVLPAQPGEFKDVPRLMLATLPERFIDKANSWPEQAQATWEEVQWTQAHLWKSYLIVCRVLGSLDHLTRALFSNQFYNMLVLHPGTEVAELVRIDYDMVKILKLAIESTLKGFNDLVTPENFRMLNIWGQVVERCNSLLGIMHLPISTVQSDLVAILALCRVTALLLDLALVSYVGSHGTRFDSYNASGSESIYITSQRKELSHLPSFHCSLKSLACLEGFLDSTKVWVFQSSEEKQTLPVDAGRGKGLSILTRMDDFADIWGPVWPVPTAAAGAGSPLRYRQYNVSRGFIRPVAEADAVARFDGAVACHWYSSSTDSDGKALEETAASKTLLPNDRLLIGASLQLNRHCIYSFNHFESDFGPSMGYLGTIPPTWRFDTRTLGVTLGQYVGLTANGTQKKLPGVTLKEHIWNKFTQSPRNANIEWLENYVGVVVSHCTGNAKRLPMKDLFRMPRVQERLDQYYPNWKATDWGIVFSDALEAGNRGAIRQVWQDYPGMREEIAKLICALLELLHLTGEQGQHFVAAYFSNHVDKQVELNIQGNEWAKCLRESVRTATYAVVGDVCLKCRTRGETTGICSHDPDKTVFQTIIDFPDEVQPSESDLVRLDPSGELFRIDEIRGARPNFNMTLMPADGQLAMRLLHPNIKVATEIIEEKSIDGGGLRGFTTAIIKASSMSYGGMPRKRQQIRPRREQPLQEQRPEEPRRRPREQAPRYQRSEEASVTDIQRNYVDRQSEEEYIPRAPRASYRDRQHDELYARRIPQAQPRPHSTKHQRARRNHPEGPRVKRHVRKIEPSPPPSSGCCCFQ